MGARAPLEKIMKTENTLPETVAPTIWVANKYGTVGITAPNIPMAQMLWDCIAREGETNPHHPNFKMLSTRP